ncbi:MAG: DUF2288 domain-containing protein [Gammaproteobacteria bacterium]|nr:DUF2288 domain-containing protein [Gammaproteobacteria bacterium]
MSDHQQLVRQELNEQTAKIGWKELERHFARGVLVKVAAELDLVVVGEAMVRDDAKQLGVWASAGKVVRASEEDARRWVDNDTVFWAVVVAPWVLVQEVYEAD